MITQRVIIVDSAMYDQRELPVITEYMRQHHPDLASWIHQHDNVLLLSKPALHRLRILCLIAARNAAKKKQASLFTTYYIPHDQTLLWSLYELVDVSGVNAINATNPTRSFPYEIHIAGYPVIRTYEQYKKIIDYYNASCQKEWQQRRNVPVALAHYDVIARVISLLGDLVDVNTTSLCNNPVSMDRNALCETIHRNYYYAPKIDGDRNLLFVWHNTCYLINRIATSARLVSTHDDWNIWHDSIFDVEWYTKSTPNIVYVLDAIRIQSIALASHPFHTRLREIRSFVRSLKHNDTHQEIQVQRYRRVRHYLDVATRWMPVHANTNTNANANTISTMSNTIPTTDGVIFVDCNAVYKLGYDHSLLKWKPARDNTIDFEVIDSSHIGVTGDVHMTFLLSEPVYANQIGKIVECACVDTSRLVWRVVRTRHDKTRSNATWVVRRIIESIRDNITDADLCQVIDQKQKESPHHAIATTLDKISAGCLSKIRY